MRAALLTKFAESPEALTTAEIDELATLGESVRSIAVGSVLSLVEK